MIKITLDLDNKQFESLVEKLPIAEKIRLAQRLNLDTWQVRFKSLIQRIESHLKSKRALSNDEIVRIVKKIRKRNYAQSHH